MKHEAYIPRHLLPNSMALMKKLAKYAGIDYEDSYREFGVEQVTFDDYSHHVAMRDGSSKSATLIGAWQHRIQSGNISVSDIYFKPFVFDLPEQIAYIKYPDLGEYRISGWAAYVALGIPIEEWIGWTKAQEIAKYPHFIYRYRMIAESYGVELSPAMYDRMFTALRDMNLLPRETYFGVNETHDKISLSWMKEWADTARSLKKMGSDYSKISDLGLWVVDGWGTDSISKLSDAGITMLEAKRLYDFGLKNSDLIYKHLVSGMPLDWAMGIYRAKSENT